MKYQSSLLHHYSPGHSSLQFSISSTDGSLDEETIRIAYRMVSSILVNAAVAHASNTRQATPAAQTYRNERVPLDSSCSEVIRKTVHEDAVSRMELV